MTRLSETRSLCLSMIVRDPFFLVAGIGKRMDPDTEKRPGPKQGFIGQAFSQEE